MFNYVSLCNKFQTIKYNFNYRQTTTTEPGRCSRHNETSPSRSSIHFPDDGTFSIFQSSMQITLMSLCSFFSYIK